MKRSLLILAAAALVIGTMTKVSANTVESSTMWFYGSLTESSGVYTGTIDAIAGYYYYPGGPGTSYNSATGTFCTPDGTEAIGGWDVYAREGGTAYYDDALQGPIGADHDAYSSGGGWGSFYSPDVRDWENYQLTLTADHWYLEFKGENLGTPMSGAMDWARMYASEDDTGSYRGTVPADPNANDGDAAANGGGAQAWDMDWTWGSEVIPLEYPGFLVSVVVGQSTGEYWVSLAPAPVPEPATLLVWSLLGGMGWMGLSVSRRKMLGGGRPPWSEESRIAIRQIIDRRQSR